MSVLLRKPGAWLPIILSLAALTLLLVYVAMFGTIAEPEPHDERTPARLFQLLMAAQTLAILVFAARWLPRAPREASMVIALQVLVAAVPIVAVLLLES